MVKHVTPADPAASIYDFARGGFLPPVGLDVELTPYWISLAARGDVVIADAHGSGAPGSLPDASQITGTGYLLRINGVERLFSLGELQAILTPLLGGGGSGDGSPSDLTTNFDDEASSALVPGLTA